MLSWHFWFEKFLLFVERKFLPPRLEKPKDASRLRIWLIFLENEWFTKPENTLGCRKPKKKMVAREKVSWHPGDGLQLFVLFILSSCCFRNKSPSKHHMCSGWSWWRCRQLQGGQFFPGEVQGDCWDRFLGCQQFQQSRSGAYWNGWANCFLQKKTWDLYITLSRHN